MRRGTRHARWLAAVLLPALALGLSSCAGSFTWIKDRLPPPQEVQGGILFRFSSPSARQVTLAGNFNNWGGTQTGRYDPSIDPMTDADGDGVWSIVVPLPPGRYQYKFVIDGGGRWEEDPGSFDTIDDGYGGVNSLIVVPPTVSYGYETITGTVIGGGRGFDRSSVRKTPEAEFVTVSLEADFPDAERVYVAGTFNEWNGTDVALEKGEDGVFRTTFKLPPGIYQYKFVVDGTWVEDPANPETIDDGYGGVNSVLIAE
jgi:1,4-alpha-glucan branching enzyme